MKNSNSVLTNKFSNLVNSEAIKFDSKVVIKFSHKWLQFKEPIDLNESSEITLTRESSDCLITTEDYNDPLLKLVCLLFEEKADIPSNRCQFYKEGLELLLNKWDDTLQVKGERIYKSLSLQQKQDLLSKIALSSYEKGEFIFKQDLENYIANYIYNLPNAPKNPEVLQLVSEAVLKSIECQHELLVEQAQGIYSFSDLKFHQYFAAREIVESYNSQASESALKNLLDHITEPRWQEVFLLVAGMLRNGDYLLHLMKQHIDAIVAVDSELQNFLIWLHEKSNSNKAAFKPASFRAFYLEFILDLDFADAFEQEPSDYNVKPARIEATPIDLAIPFTAQQKALLKQYYEANQLLLDCVRNARYITRAVREEIEENLLVLSASCSK